MPRVLEDHEALALRRGAEHGHNPFQNFDAQSGLLGCVLQTETFTVVAEDVFGHAEGELSFLAGLLQFLERVAAFPHAGDDPCLGRFDVTQIATLRKDRDGDANRKDVVAVSQQHSRTLSVDAVLIVELAVALEIPCRHRHVWTPFRLHEAKFGIQSRWNYHSASISTPGDTTYNNQGGGPGEAGLCLEQQHQTAGCNLRTDSPAYENHQSGFSIGGFVQDRWQVTKWLRINPGLRIDYGQTTNSVGQVVSNLLGFGPRLGLVFDLTQDQKTIFTAYYGRANEVLSLLASTYADISATSTINQYNHATNSWSPRNTTGGIDGYRVENDFSDPERGKVLRGLENHKDREPPHTDEITLSFRREVFQNSAAGVDYTYKRVGNIWDSIEANQIWDPSGTRVIDHVNGQSQQIFLYARPDENWRVYQGVDFTLESRPRQEWDFSVVYTLSWLYGPGAEQFAQVSNLQSLSQFYNRRLFGIFDGFLPEDHRHNLKIRASYTYKGLTVGTFMNYLSGAPLTKRFYNQNEARFTNRRSPTGTEPSMPNDVAAISEFRLPATLTMDTRISYDLQSVLKKVHLTLIADVFNLFDLDAATSLQTRDLMTFGQINSRQRPLRVQLGLRLQY